MNGSVQGVGEHARAQATSGLIRSKPLMRSTNRMANLSGHLVSFRVFSTCPPEIICLQKKRRFRGRWAYAGSV